MLTAGAGGVAPEHSPFSSGQGLALRTGVRWEDQRTTQSRTPEVPGHFRAAP